MKKTSIALALLASAVPVMSGFATTSPAGNPYAYTYNLLNNATYKDKTVTLQLNSVSAGGEAGPVVVCNGHTLHYPSRVVPIGQLSDGGMVSIAPNDTAQCTTSGASPLFPLPTDFLFAATGPSNGQTCIIRGSITMTQNGTFSLDSTTVQNVRTECSS